MAHIGDKIRALREEKGLSRSEFCDTEFSLTTRQLMRIENGESNPSIESIQYIADRLEVPTYQLMLDFYELPDRYKELKYLFLRQTVYGEKSILKQREEYLEELFSDYYDDLPEEEQSLLNCWQTSNRILMTGQVDEIAVFVENTMLSFKDKKYYTTNDLSFIQLFAFYLSRVEKPVLPDYLLLLANCVSNLLKQVDFFNPDSLFIYTNCLMTCLSFFNSISDYSKFRESLVVLKGILDKTQDFQKKPLISMLEWKVALFEENDLTLAFEKFQEAKVVAQALALPPVLVGLDYEWKKDVDKFNID